MRQIASDELQFCTRFAVGRVGNSWFQCLANRDIAKREAGAKQVCQALLTTLRDPMFFGSDSLPAGQSEVEALIRSAVLALGPLTHNAARSGHQGTRADARNLIAERIVEQLAPFEILVSDPLEGHGDRVGQKPC
ncbi:hypothetical protein [Sphingomonas sp. NFR15]|uniref:hypothetical protein n=1 Tax=Sphingomonas sp. NFR15 TaxID=1566282 RepID=UPI0008821A83|nr:hypothetical protein [Sphingomonas sp. NFR15]SDA14841.1 hypothetical protein SAMN03159340_00602 [Sphingomonas sp. NFR15]